MVRQKFKRDYETGLFLPSKRMFLPKWMNARNPGCCGCGGTTCTLFSDNFTRADSTSIGASWTEVSGNWEIISNTLRVTSAFIPAVVVSSSAPSQQEYSMTWTYTNASSGDKIRAIYGYVNTSNFYFAELELTSSTTATIKLYQKSGGSDTLLSTSSSFAVVSGSGSINMCYNGTILSASTPGYTASYVSYPISAPAGTELFGAGIANPVTTSDARFTNVELKKVETACELCRPGNCCATDETGPIPRPICCMFDEFGPPITMQVDIAGAYDNPLPFADEDCPWCGSDPTVGSWIVTNAASYGTLPCTLTPGPCYLLYDDPTTQGPDGCIGGLQICRSQVQVSFNWIDVCSTYKVALDQIFYYDSFPGGTHVTCVDDSCGGLGAGISTWMRWTKTFSWPSGGINAATLGIISLDPDHTHYVGTAASGRNDICSYTNATCTVEFLT